MAAPEDTNWGHSPRMILHPAITLDASEGRPAGVTYGRARGQKMVLHPAVVVSGEPAILMTIRPPAGTTAEQVAADFQNLFRTLTAHERALGGDGLAFELTAGRHGQMHWRVTAERADGAVDRLRRLNELLSQAEPPADIRGAWEPVAATYRPDVNVMLTH